MINPSFIAGIEKINRIIDRALHNIEGTDNITAIQNYKVEAYEAGLVVIRVYPAHAAYFAHCLFYLAHYRE